MSSTDSHRQLGLSNKSISKSISKQASQLGVQKQGYSGPFGRGQMSDEDAVSYVHNISGVFEMVRPSQLTKNSQYSEPRWRDIAVEPVQLDVLPVSSIFPPKEDSLRDELEPSISVKSRDLMENTERFTTESSKKRRPQGSYKDNSQSAISSRNSIQHTPIELTHNSDKDFVDPSQEFAPANDPFTPAKSSPHEEDQQDGLSMSKIASQVGYYQNDLIEEDDDEDEVIEQDDDIGDYIVTLSPSPQQSASSTQSLKFSNLVSSSGNDNKLKHKNKFNYYQEDPNTPMTTIPEQSQEEESKYYSSNKIDKFNIQNYGMEEMLIMDEGRQSSASKQSEKVTNFGKNIEEQDFEVDPATESHLSVYFDQSPEIKQSGKKLTSRNRNLTQANGLSQQNPIMSAAGEAISDISVVPSSYQSSNPSFMNRHGHQVSNPQYQQYNVSEVEENTLNNNRESGPLPSLDLTPITEITDTNLF